MSSIILAKKYINIETKSVTFNQLNLKIYTPYNLKPTSPIMLYVHGGGWVIGSIKSYDRMLRIISHHLECTIVTIDYRKAPEYRFPTALEDIYTCYIWIIRNYPNITKSNTNLIFGGDSAGGNLVLGLLKKLKTLNGIQNLVFPKLMILIYPVVITELFFNRKYKFKNLKFLILNKIGKIILRFCIKNYIKDVQAYDAQYLNFLKYFDKDIQYPTTLILTADLDPLTHSIRKYTRKLKSTGTKVRIINYQKVFHGFINFQRFSSQATNAIQDIASFIKHYNS